jgi:hypothetical protein
MAESVIGLYKAEVIRHEGPWKGLEEVEFATLEWVDWFNNTRLLEPIGYVPPAEFEEANYAHAAAMEAEERLKRESLQQGRAVQTLRLLTADPELCIFRPTELSRWDDVQTAAHD